MTTFHLSPIAVNLVRLAHERREAARAAADQLFNDALKPVFDEYGIAPGEQVRYELPDDGSAVLVLLQPVASTGDTGEPPGD